MTSDIHEDYFDPKTLAPFEEITGLLEDIHHTDEHLYLELTDARIRLEYYVFEVATDTEDVEGGDRALLSVIHIPGSEPPLRLKVESIETLGNTHK